jgi:hypothetical protein
MQIDWLNKWMVINFNGTSCQLQGIHPSLPAFSLVELLLVSEFDSKDASPSVLAPIQCLLQTFENLFAEPTQLPPDRPCNHSIPLVLGAQPVNVRPYRFSPTMKDEVEAQL